MIYSLFKQGHCVANVSLLRRAVHEANFNCEDDKISFQLIYEQMMTLTLHNIVC